MSDTANSITGHDLTPRDRAIACGFILATTTAYVLSFLAVGRAYWFGTALRINVAATASWVALGIVLTGHAAWRNLRLIDWMDACLSALTPGVVMLGTGAAANFAVGLATAWRPLGPDALGLIYVPFHVLLLVATNIVMGIAFVGTAAGRLGVSAPIATGLWLVGLNTPFVILLVALNKIGGVS